MNKSHSSTLIFTLLVLFHLFTAHINAQTIIRETKVVFDEPTKDFANFCILPADVPLSSSQFTAYLTLTFAASPYTNEISFLQIDENDTVFLGNFAQIEMQYYYANSIVLILHDGYDDFFGFNSQIFNDFQFVVGVVNSDVPLLSISLQFIADSFVPGLANECPIMEGLPFQLIPYQNQIATSDEEIIDQIENNDNNNINNNNNYNDEGVNENEENYDDEYYYDNDEKVHHKHHKDSSDDDNEKKNSNGLVIILCTVFSIVILFSCAMSTYVIFSTLQSEPKHKKEKNNFEAVELEGGDDIPEDQEFLV